MAVTSMVDTIGHGLPLSPIPFKLVSLIVALLAVGFTSIQYYQTCGSSQQPLRQGSLFHDALPSKIASNSSLPFNENGRFQIEGFLSNVAISYVNAIRIDSYEQAIMFEVSRKNWKSDDGRDLRLIISNAGKFMEARPRQGQASILLKPAVLSTLCLHQSPSANHPCSLTLTIMADNSNTDPDPVAFVLSGLIATMIRHDRPVSVFLPAGQLSQVAIQIQAPGVDIAADGSCRQPIYLSAISESDLRSGHLSPVLSSKPDVPADHYSLRIAKDFHLVLMRCEQDCVITIEAKSLPAIIPATWNWTLFARTLLLAIFIFCLLTPTVILLVVYRPQMSSTESQTHPSQPSSSSQDQHLEQKRLKNMTVLASIPLKRFADSSCMKNFRCSICLEAYKADDLVRDLTCAHRFHNECCDSWIIEKGHCPLCLQDIGHAVNYHVEPKSNEFQLVLQRAAHSA